MKQEQIKIEPFKFNIGDKIQNKIIIDRFIGKNAFERYTNVYLYQDASSNRAKMSIRCTEQGILRKLTN